MSPFALLQEKPSKEIDVVTDLVAGNMLRLVKKKGRYYACEMPDGRKGFLPKSAVAVYKRWISNKATVENVIQSAKTCWAHLTSGVAPVLKGLIAAAL
ncbi:MAG: hypothetical protein IPM85_17275 [Chitinophagaceae bacterium]|nr:hypothetical protein [Chitinophagaceae bacterium]